ncbi:MAG TPA: dTMP kinase [Verrucomicrobiota bacterium]|nr:dTMP kinase [Verrucomicrobiota bacterium]
MAGVFITFEGTEGAGKSTQVRLLAARLRAAGHVVRELREPGGTAVGEAIRELVKHRAGPGLAPEAELLLMNASRAQLVREVIRPALAAGEVVVCDRFLDSTTAYQGHGRGLDLGMVRAVIDAAVGPTRPDLTLWLTLPAAAATARLAARDAGGDRFEAEGREFFERVETGYAAIAAAEPGRVVAVSAEGTPAEVADRVWAAVEPLWAVPGRDR